MLVALQGRATAPGQWLFQARGGHIHSSHCPIVTPLAGRGRALESTVSTKLAFCWEGGPEGGLPGRGGDCAQRLPGQLWPL